jgi:molecular chaperone DnaK
LKEYGDKLADDKKAPIEEGLKKLKDAHAAKDFTAMDTAQAELQAAWNVASEDMYKASQEGGQAAGDAGQQAADDTVTDVDFEEVKEDDKK